MSSSLLQSPISDPRSTISSTSLRADADEELAVERFIGDLDRDDLYAVGIGCAAAIIGRGGRIPSLQIGAELNRVVEAGIRIAGVGELVADQGRDRVARRAGVAGCCARHGKGRDAIRVGRS